MEPGGRSVLPGKRGERSGARHKLGDCCAAAPAWPKRTVGGVRGGRAWCAAPRRHPSPAATGRLSRMPAQAGKTKRELSPPPSEGCLLRGWRNRGSAPAPSGGGDAGAQLGSRGSFVWPRGSAETADRTALQGN
ncbi:hypothetical protein NDU88_005625 [Pleurodeles waltl]|uniref:Uncharacterized protein n=1 Tax=Pleurodeles waltl TaxID=8319 RepID=A0AAV7VP28_PLEWA|nr:hypothetical protein NDU88_005625 [Pleurodeles waltl]